MEGVPIKILGRATLIYRRYFLYRIQGPRRGKGLVGLSPYHFCCWDLLSSAPVDMEKAWVLLLESNK